jgi:hypothetical protein
MTTARFWGRSSVEGAHLHYWSQSGGDGMRLRSMCNVTWVAKEVTPTLEGIKCEHCKIDPRVREDEKAAVYAKLVREDYQ